MNSTASYFIPACAQALAELFRGDRGELMPHAQGNMYVESSLRSSSFVVDFVMAWLGVGVHDGGRLTCKPLDLFLACS